MASGVAAVYATYRLFRPRLEEPVAVAVAAKIAVSPQIVSFTHQVMTEVPYLLLSLVTLMAVERYAAPSVRWRSGSLALAAGSLIVALLVRSIGIALLAAAVAYLVLEGGGDAPRPAREGGRRRRPVPGGLARRQLLDARAHPLRRRAGAGERPRSRGPTTQGWSIACGPTWTATSTPSRRRSRTASSCGRQASAAGWRWSSSRVGFVAAARRRRTVVEYYLLAYWRCCSPIRRRTREPAALPRAAHALPDLLLAYGVRWAVTALRLRRPVLAGSDPAVGVTIAVLALFGAANLFETARASVLRVRPEMFDFRPYTDSTAAGAWRAGREADTPSGSLISTQDPYGFYFWSQRQVTWHPYVPPGAGGDAVARGLVAEDVDYVAVDRSQDAPFATFLEHHPDAFVQVYARRTSALYQVRPPARRPGVAR